MLRKLIVLKVIFLFLITILIIPAQSYEIFTNDIIYVDDDGNSDYDRIQDAIDNSSDGDIIFVYNGEYYENLIINKSINLIGENKYITIINGNRLGIVITINTDEVEISNFTISNSGKYDAGISTNYSNNYIFNNIIKNNYDGILLNYNKNNLIEKNEIKKNGRKGIGIEYSNKNSVYNNNISYNSLFGLFIKHSNLNNISHNLVIDNNWDGLVFQNSSYNLLFGNDISGSKYYGVNLFSTDNTNNIIYKNNFFNNSINARGENENIWYNKFKGNYWDDYLDKYPNANKLLLLGVWDIPYEIEGGDNIDLYPLIKKYKTIESFLKLDNQPPNTPIIIGPKIGKAKELYTYIITSIDPDGDKINYYIDWGDDTILITKDYYQSGEMLKIKYIYPNTGEYNIRVKATDIFGAQSDWGMFGITMPKYKSIYNNSFINRLIDLFTIYR